MLYRRLGQNGPEVSVVAFGAWQIGDPTYWGADAAADAEGALAAALDAGVNLFDTAEMYAAGEAERVLGQLLGARRSKVLIASKVKPDNCVPGGLRAACEGSLQRLGTDVIDLYQIHWPFRQMPFEDAYAELAALRDEGKIRYIGVSNFGPTDLDAWFAKGECVSDQVAYSLVFRAIEHEIVPACTRRGVGVMAYMPLLQGLVSCRWASADEMPENRRRTRHFSSERSATRHGEAGCEELTFKTLAELKALAAEIGVVPAALALAWVIAQPGVSTALLGARNAAQLAANLEAVDLLPLSAELDARLEALSRPLKDRLGANADLWFSAENSRIK